VSSLLCRLIAAAGYLVRAALSSNKCWATTERAQPSHGSQRQETGFFFADAALSKRAGLLTNSIDDFQAYRSSRPMATATRLQPG